jgi:hypothetical protein
MTVLDALLAEQASKRFGKMLGSTHRFLIDGPAQQAGQFHCRPWFDAPEIDWQYTVRVESCASGAILNARVVGGRPGEVSLELV